MPVNVCTSQIYHHGKMFSFCGIRNVFYSFCSFSFWTIIMECEKVVEQTDKGNNKEVKASMCHITDCGIVMHYSLLWKVMCLDAAGNNLSLWPGQSYFSPSRFFLYFLHFWQHMIILPFLEWLQQRHCYSQRAVCSLQLNPYSIGLACDL